jgi:uncharacterized protein YceK
MKPAYIAILCLCLSGCAGVRKHFNADHSYPADSSDRAILAKLGYTGEHAGVYWVGSTKCFTNNDLEPYPQKDLRCF